MKKEFIFAMPALMLVLALTSCDEVANPPIEAAIPPALQGTYRVISGTKTEKLVINANGTGKLNKTDCTFTVDESVKKLSILVGTVTYSVDYAVSSGQVTFSGLAGPSGGVLITLGLFTGSAHTPDKTRAIIPDELQGQWKSTRLTGTFPNVNVGTVIFEIDGSGNGKTYNTSSNNMDNCTWRAENGKITLTWDGGALYGIMICTFDYALSPDETQLSLSNAVSDSNPYSALLRPYTDFSPLQLAD